MEFDLKSDGSRAIRARPRAPDQRRLGDGHVLQLSARGYQPKTDPFNDCVVRMESERSQRMESNRRYQLEKSDNPTTANRGF